MKRVKDSWYNNGDVIVTYVVTEDVHNELAYFGGDILVKNSKKNNAIEFAEQYAKECPNHGLIEVREKTEQVNGENFDILDEEVIFEIKKSEISDSRKIKDADETQDVLDGILMIAFNDGSEEEGYNEVKKHANEQGELEGVQYETYDVDNQDGVTLIDLCAATDDANAFVKALLTEWGIIDAVADIEFEKSELMENAEVSDSRRVSDYRSPLDAIENAFNSVANELGTEQLSPKFYEKVNKYIKTYPIAEGGNSCTIVYQGAKYDVSYDFRDNRFYASKDEWNLSEAIEKRRKLLGVSDSKVEDMTKPAHLRGYAEKYRKKRREQKESYKENEEETQDKEVSDSKTIKNNKTMKRVKDDALRDFEINGFVGTPAVAGDYYKLTYGSETIYQDSANEDCYDEDSAYAFFEELLDEIGEQAQLAIKSAIDNGFKVSNTNSIESVWEDACDYLIDNTEHTMEYCELRSTGRSQRYDFGEYWEDGEIFDFNWHYKEKDKVLFRQEGNDFVWVNWFDIPMDGEPDRSNYGFVFDTIVYDGEVLDLYDMFE